MRNLFFLFMCAFMSIMSGCIADIICITQITYKMIIISDLCDADYVGYTARHLFQRVTEHKNSAIGNNFHEAHGRRDLLNESHFKILRKCLGRFDCLVFEMLFIKKFKRNLNVQTDSIGAKLFV